MKKVIIKSGERCFTAKLETEKAPRTCSLFLDMLPMTVRVVHVRWSGEGFWIPFGDHKVELPPENSTSHPGRGDVLLYPGGQSEMEIVFAYGGLCFSSKVGQLAGNHFMTIEDNHPDLATFGKMVLWNGAQEITIAEAGTATA